MPAPSCPGAVHDTVAWPAPTTASTPVGVPGGPTLTASDGVDEIDVPPGPTPTTTNVYGSPASSPVTVHQVATVTHVCPPEPVTR
ncbi:hypothetical protein GCM10009557_94310 [Virgisporangium ochraceum]